MRLTLAKTICFESKIPIYIQSVNNLKAFVVNAFLPQNFSKLFNFKYVYKNHKLCVLKVFCLHQRNELKFKKKSKNMCFYHKL